MTNEPSDDTPPERGPDGVSHRLRFLARGFRTAADVFDEAAAVVEGSKGEPLEALLWDLRWRARAVGDLCHDGARAISDLMHELRIERMKR